MFRAANGRGLRSAHQHRPRLRAVGRHARADPAERHEGLSWRRVLTDKADMEDFVMAFDSNLKPIVGQQVTLTSTSPVAARARLDLLIQQVAKGNCDVVANSEDNGYFYTGGEFLRDDGQRYSLSRLEQRVISQGPGHLHGGSAR